MNWTRKKLLEHRGHNIVCVSYGLGVESTKENAGRLRDRLRHHSFTDMMIEAGWNVIHGTINDLFEE